ncbi:MAG: glycosyltransferase family 25 protein [Rhizobium sp.]|nr:glycosyltransferase family 25 protein [Rhizobium sp.]
MAARFETVVISLIHAVARREAVADNLDGRRDTAWRFFDALRADSDAVSLPSVPDRQVARYGRRLGASEIGCFKSHYAVLQAFLREGGTPWLLVLEDDVWLDPAFDIAEVIDAAEQRELNCVRLFVKMHKPARMLGMLSGFRQLLRYTSEPYGMQAYLISKAGAAAFVNSIQSIDLPIDDELGRFWRHKLPPVSVFPFPAVERAVPSNLEADRQSHGASRVSWRLRLIAFRVSEKLQKIAFNLLH